MSLPAILVVIAILALLVAILIPSLKFAQDRIKQAKCASNLHQIALAGLAYAADNNGYFPKPNTLQHPFKVGGTLPGEDPASRPLNEYVDNNFKLFVCPADTVPYKPDAGAASWAGTPFYQTQGTSYLYNSYVGEAAKVLDGTQRSGLQYLKVWQIKSPSRMVFFADQDARAMVYGGSNWKRLTLWWHSPKNQQLRANVAFVDGSVRLVDIVNDDTAKYSFYNDSQ